MTRSLNKALSIKSQNKHMAYYRGELSDKKIKKKHKKELSKRKRLEIKRDMLDAITMGDYDHEWWRD